MSRSDVAVSGEGSTFVPALPQQVWDSLLDVDALKAVVPGCKSLAETSPHTFEGKIELGVGIVKGLFDADVRLFDLETHRSLRLAGEANGALGTSGGEGVVTLAAEGTGTRINYVYGLDLSGKVAAIGGRMIKGAARVLIAEFFKRLAFHASSETEAAGRPAAAENSLFSRFGAAIARLLGIFGRNPP